MNILEILLNYFLTNQLLFHRLNIEYDFSQERNFKFNGLTMDETIYHLAVFVSRLWQIHVFGDDHVIIRTKLEKPSKINGLALN